MRRVEFESRNRVIYALLKHLTVNKSMKSSRTHAVPEERGVRREGEGGLDPARASNKFRE